MRARACRHLWHHAPELSLPGSRRYECGSCRGLGYRRAKEIVAYTDQKKARAMVRAALEKYRFL